jgi:hypothetical protein
VSEKQTLAIGKGKPGPGRKKGVPNKANQELREMILGALDASGGVAYLTERAKDPRTASAFLSLIGKVLPMQVTGEGGGAVVFEKIVREIVRPK